MTPEFFEQHYRIIFFSSVALALLLERLAVFKRQPVDLAPRWITNIGLFLINNSLGRVLLPAGIIKLSLDQPTGLLTAVQMPFAVQLLLTFLLLDGCRYWEHRLLHQIPLLWRMHLVHHSDTQIDVTTAERHHPLESLLSTLLMVTLVVGLGLPTLALAIYLLCAVAVELFVHANLRLPPAVDRSLSWLIMTPAVHAVHHSALQTQTDSNFGAILTIWDRLFGSFVDPQRERIEFFGLNYFCQPVDAGLGSAVLQPFLFRQAQSNSARELLPHSPLLAQRKTVFALSPAWRKACFSGAIAVGLMALVLWPTALTMLASWRDGEAYQYAWLVLPMFVYLVGWQARDDLLAASPRHDASGIALGILAALCWCVGELMNVNLGRQFGLVLALQAVAMAAMGWRLYWRYFPMFALLFFMIPSGDVLLPLLRQLTVTEIEWFVSALGLPHQSTGFRLLIGQQRYVVVDACAGLSYVTLTTFLGYCFGLLLYRSFFKVVALAILGGVLGIFSNWLRVDAIVLIDQLRGTQMDLTAHGSIQWLALAVAMALLLYVLTRLKLEKPAAVAESGLSLQNNTGLRFAPLLAALAVTTLVGLVASLPTHAMKVHPGQTVDPLANNTLDWKLVAGDSAWQVDPGSQTASLRVSYRRDGKILQVVVIDALSSAAKLPDSPVAADEQKKWRDVGIAQHRSCSDTTCLTLRHTTWQPEARSNFRHVYHAYSIGSFSADSRLASRAAHGWQRLLGGQSGERMIGFMLDEALPAGAGLNQEYRLVVENLNALLPNS